MAAYQTAYTQIYTYTLARITVRRAKKQDGSYEVQDNCQDFGQLWTVQEFDLKKLAQFVQVAISFHSGHRKPKAFCHS